MFRSVNAVLEPDNLYDTVKKKLMIAKKSTLYDLLLTIILPDYTTDSAHAIRQVRQNYIDESGNVVSMQVDEYVSVYMRTLCTLVIKEIPTMVYIQ